MTRLPHGFTNLYRTFLGLITLHALGAYSLGQIPIQWLAQMGIVALTIWIFARQTVKLAPGFSLLMAFTLWALVVALINLETDAAHLMPQRGSTSYLGYLALRFLIIWSFLATVFCAYWLCRHVGVWKLSEDLSNVGVLISLFAFYIYLAQVYGWPEPPRLRSGTGGGAQTTTFTYAFHRAMGSFREPSHLAEWLVLPFFLSLTLRRLSAVKSIIILGAILLSGSMTGIVAIGVGLLAASFLHLSRPGDLTWRWLRVGAPLGLAGIVFSLLVSRGQGFQSLTDTIWLRLRPVFFEMDAQQTNRDYVYNYLNNNPVSFVGEGLGNANLVFTHSLKVDATASFLNLYVNVLYSLGIIGLALLLVTILYPVVLKLITRQREVDGRQLYLWAAYLGWLVIFVAHAEELSVHFGIGYAMVMAGMQQGKKLGHEA